MGTTIIMYVCNNHIYTCAPPEWSAGCEVCIVVLLLRRHGLHVLARLSQGIAFFHSGEHNDVE